MEIGSVLQTALEADRHDRNLLGGPHAQSTVRELARVARATGVAAIHPASRSGERLVGALLFTARDLHLWDGSSPEPVLVIDGVIASTAGLQHVMELVRRVGASDVRGIAVTYTSEGRAAESNAPDGVALIAPRLRPFHAA
jgi:hypothetical protein